MKKVFKMLFVLLIIYLFIQICFSFFGNGHKIEYKIDNAVIVETYTNKTKNETTNYYFDIDVNGEHFYLQTYHNFNTAKKVIKNVKLLQTANSFCILPIFKGNTLVTDIMCKVGKDIVYYRDLKGGDVELDSKISAIAEYNSSKWQNNLENNYKHKSVTVYKNNILKDYLVGINSYKGLYTIDKANANGIIEVNIFNSDVYTRKISGTVKSTYITAAYDVNHSFNRFYTLKLDSKNVGTITTSHEISFDSYVQGIIDNSMYIFDRDNKVQYEVNIKTKTVTITGNVSMGIKFYNNGKWETKSAYDAINSELIFVKDKQTDYLNDNFVRIDKQGNEKSGFYYLYKQEGSYFKVYRSNVQNKESLTYLFTTNKIDNIYYFDDTVFYTFNNEVRYYNDELGVRTLFVNTEFEFNNSLIYSVYKK